MSGIHFFCEDIDYKLKDPDRLTNWMKEIVSRESKKSISSINFIFCSDHYLHSINQQYLKHDTYTDIITFDHSDEPDELEADIFISMERVTENSHLYKERLEDELNRVMIHGILHLLGYSDSGSIEKENMRKKENECLNLLEN